MTIQKANELALERRNINWIYMYDFRGKLIQKFKSINDAAEKLNKASSSISNYIRKENKYDGIHFLCRSK